MMRQDDYPKEEHHNYEQQIAKHLLLYLINLQIFKVFITASTCISLSSFYYSPLSCYQSNLIAIINSNINLMSIYSGFATRQQEEHYDQTIATLLYIMQRRICKFYNNETTNDLKFIDMLIRLQANLKTMEQSKYLEPKLSRNLAEVVQLLKNKRQSFEQQQLKKNPLSSISEQRISTLRDNSKKKNPQNQSRPITEVKVRNPIMGVTQRGDKYPYSEMRTHIIKKRLPPRNQDRTTIISETQIMQQRNKDDKDISLYLEKPGSPKRQGNNDSFAKEGDTKRSKEKIKDLVKLQKDQTKNSNINMSKNYSQQKVNHSNSFTKIESNKVKQEPQQDVRSLIKGYLSKKKKQQERKQKQIYQIFQE